MPKQYEGDLNIQPPLCCVCGAPHEPEYPHEATDQLREHVQQEKGRPATAFDLVSHTTGLMREAVSNELLKKLEI